MKKNQLSRLMLFTLILMAGMVGMRHWAHAGKPTSLHHVTQSKALTS